MRRKCKNVPERRSGTFFDPAVLSASGIAFQRARDDGVAADYQQHRDGEPEPVGDEHCIPGSLDRVTAQLCGGVSDEWVRKNMCTLTKHIRINLKQINQTKIDGRAGNVIYINIVLPRRGGNGSGAGMIEAAKMTNFPLLMRSPARELCPLPENR